MGVIRKTFQRQIMDMLDASHFTSDDFDVEFGDHSSNEGMVMIVFKYDENYNYTIYKNGSTGYLVKRRPGKFEEEEYEQINHFEHALNGISKWCIEVRNELKATQFIYSEVDKLREIIAAHIKGDSESGEFSAEEIHKLLKKFEELERRVQTLEKDKIITETQLEEFLVGMKQVKDDLEFYPKPTWIRTATNKLVKTVTSIGKSKEGRALLADGARKLLGFE